MTCCKDCVVYCSHFIIFACASRQALILEPFPQCNALTSVMWPMRASLRISASLANLGLIAGEDGSNLEWDSAVELA